MTEIFRGITPFLWADLILLVLLMVFSELALWLARSTKPRRRATRRRVYPARGGAAAGGGG